METKEIIKNKNKNNIEKKKEYHTPTVKSIGEVRTVTKGFGRPDSAPTTF